MQAPLLFSHVDHDLTRPTLLAGPDGCGKTQYARQCLKRFRIIESTCLPVGELLDTMQTMLRGAGMRKRALLAVDVHLIIKERGAEWSKFCDLCKQLSDKKVPVVGVADWGGGGGPVRRLPPEVKKSFYAVEVAPPPPA